MYTNIDDNFEEMFIEPNRSHYNSTTILAKKNKNGRGVCAICGAKPTGINFDVLTCSSCKAFFRRNGVKPLHQFICRSNGECKVDERSRRQCTACRLRKCFAMGMIKERIRTEEQNQRHRALVAENRRLKLRKYQEQEENRSKLCKERRHERLYSRSSCSSSNSHLIDVDLFFDLYLEATQEIVPENFFFQFDHDITNVLNAFCVPISCLITFLKQISHFQQLPVDDRLVLLKNNVKILLPVLTHVFNLTLNVPIRFNHPGYQNINTKISYAHSLIAHIIPDDQKFLILVLLVLQFSPCLFTNDSLADAGSINDNSRQIIRCIYDEYIQFLWMYILEKSDDDEQQAIIIYSKLVTNIVHLQNLMSEVYDIVECSVQIDRLHIMMQSILHLT